MARASFQQLTTHFSEKNPNLQHNKSPRISTRPITQSQVAILDLLKTNESKLYLISVVNFSQTEQIPRKKLTSSEPGFIKKTRQWKSLRSAQRAPTVPQSIWRHSYSPSTMPPLCLWVRGYGRHSPNHRDNLASTEGSGLMSPWLRTMWSLVNEEGNSHNKIDRYREKDKYRKCMCSQDKVVCMLFKFQNLFKLISRL